MDNTSRHKDIDISVIIAYTSSEGTDRPVLPHSFAQNLKEGTEIKSQAKILVPSFAR